MIDNLIAEALYAFLRTRVSDSPADSRDRLFFRLEGFEGVNSSLLDLLQRDHLMVDGRTIVVRTMGVIPNYERYALDADKTATWYRNHVEPRQILLLFANQRTSDSQSLKDIFTINETVLVTQGLRDLIRAAFLSGYQLTDDDWKILCNFIECYRSAVHLPQLRDLARFLAYLNEAMLRGESLKEAIPENLPYLGVFRYRLLAQALGNKARTERLLRELSRGANLGSELLSDKELNDYLRRLNENQFDDESDLGRLNPEQKRIILYGFLTRTINTEQERLEALNLDWEEVRRVLFKPRQQSSAEKLQQLASELESHVDATVLPAYAQAVIQDLQSGRMPNEDDVDRFVTTERDRIGKSFTRRLRRLIRARSYTHSDFIIGLTAAVVELVSDQRELVTSAVKLSVTFSEPETIKSETYEALCAFCALYGGIETIFSALYWEIANLYDLARAHHNFEEDSTPTKENQEKGSVLAFRVVLSEHDGREIARADVNWQYDADSPAAATYHALQRLDARHRREGPLIPFFVTHVASERASDLDLRHPFATLGTWFDTARNLRQELVAALDKPVIDQGIRHALDQALSDLETKWGQFVAGTLQDGFFATDLNALWDAYEGLLTTTEMKLTGGQAIKFGYRILVRAWTISSEPFEDWAILPLLHPLKLFWWHGRAKYLNSLISRLTDAEHPDELVDVFRFRKGLAQTYSSANFPAVLVLPDQSFQPMTFLPLNEVEGFELYRPETKAGASQGFDPELVSPQEAEDESAKAAEYLAGVVSDYISTYPFIRDGIEIYLVGCRNSALPGQLVEQISKREQSALDGQAIHIAVTVHTEDRGASVFEGVTDWLNAHEEFTERPTADYFPPVSMRIVECSFQELITLLFEKRTQEERLKHDIVILPDVLGERGQQVRSSREEAYIDIERDSPLIFVPLLRQLPMPFQRGEISHTTLLTPMTMSSMSRHFYNCAWAFLEQKQSRPDQATEFRLDYSLSLWGDLLRNLHKAFNWVVCYDTTIDRFLLEDTFPHEVQVIRYSTGLGVKGRHNLTASSAYWAQDVVMRRLALRLRDLFPTAPEELRNRIAERLVEEAKQISGDIVLRAAGPGAHLNELIGLVLAKYLTEQRYLAEHPNALVAWVYLDDFRHWFDGKYPDLLFIGIPTEANGELPLYAQVIETKCVTDSIFAHEADDAEDQVVRGINRLAPAWTPNREYLDADYWYDQLYRAMASNLNIHREQQRLWDALRNRLPKGDFILDISGHTWIFCYDGAGKVVGNQLQDEGLFSIEADHTFKTSLLHHWFGRRGLLYALKRLVEEWEIEGAAVGLEITHEPHLQSLEGNAATRDAPSGHETTDAEETTAEVSQVSSVKTPEKQDGVRDQARDLDRILRQYGISAFPIDTNAVDVGPSILRYKVRLKPPEKDRRLQNIASDLARELALHHVPLIEHLPGTQYIAIDIPRDQRETVPLLPALLELPPAQVGALPFLVGKTPNGQTILKDISNPELTHLLVAGTTGSGKTMFLYSLLVSLLARLTQQHLSILLVDPKQTDFVFFRNVPHLRGGHVLTDPEEAIVELQRLTNDELDTRTQLFNQAGCNTLVEFNERNPLNPLTRILVVIDEYADLLDVMGKQERGTFEREIRRLAQRARSVGIHLIIATQRPSADIVTSSLKANLPTRIAFRLPSHHDSMTILDQTGAENLLGRGDMLFAMEGRVERLQGFYLSNSELREFLNQRGY